MNKDFKYYTLSPFKWFMLENFPFIEADFDALTNWQLFCKLGKEMNKIINSTNTLGTQVESLTDYVNNYFDNLDVQEEVNNKLDEMAETGQLTDIIAQYLQLAGLLCFNTVNDLKNAENIINGSFAKTYGKNTYNDGEGEFYKIREVTNEDVIDDINIIKINTNNTLVAELIRNKTIDDKISLIYGAQTEGNEVWRPYYIDNELGNDENDGTINRPLKTFEPIVKLINKGKLKIDVGFKRGQTHIVDCRVFNACALHMYGYGEGEEKATITRNVPASTPSSSVVFYNCHLNLKDLIFTNMGYDMYCDGGSMVATECILDTKFTTWGCGCRFTNTTIKTLKARMANLWIEGDETGSSILGCVESHASIFEIYRTDFNPNFAINHEQTQACYVFNGGTLSIYGITNILTNNTPAYNRLLWFSSLGFFLSGAPNASVAGENFSLTSRIDDSKVIAVQYRLNALYNSANGIVYENGTEYPQ